MGVFVGSMGESLWGPYRVSMGFLSLYEVSVGSGVSMRGLGGLYGVSKGSGGL